MLVELLQSETDKVVRAVAIALRNLSLDRRNKDLIGEDTGETEPGYRARWSALVPSAGARAPALPLSFHPSHWTSCLPEWPQGLSPVTLQLLGTFLVEALFESPSFSLG